ncbi:MAG: AGE family epimerase/isomerase [Hyphomicrobiales bacterium]|nr:AGE family epimerase/isomerase [Hyphomicrobiales bacterium]MBV8663504.1 AGE family epimerase/isomerase [Hyphomicrobiales bacterium]
MTDSLEGKTAWRDTDGHRRWLAAEADALFAFYETDSIRPSGGFWTLDETGRPLGAEQGRPLHATTRMVHCFAVAHLLGRPGAADIVDHGVDALLTRHRDPVHGGYFWSFDDEGPRERDKLAYGHGFVLLAAASAKCAGHPKADALLSDIAEVLETRFWEPGAGASKEEFAEDWTPFSDYRGQNANMHLTEALMAAFEATGEGVFLQKAESIADLILRRSAGAADWRVPEHYKADWSVDREYKGSDMFRPYGLTPGHALEWTRLALQLWELGGRKIDWLPNAARALFAKATAEGWDQERGGFYYTLDWSGAPRVRDRLWWPCCEGIGAANVLGALDGGAEYEDWYRRIWGFCARHFIDRRNGGWRLQLDEALRPIAGYFPGKPDIYHAVQACLIPLYPTDGSLTRGILRAPNGR